jgi:hypothetical protein
MKYIKAILLVILLAISANSLTCEEWSWHKDYVSSFYCITYNGQTYMSDVRVPPNGDTPPNSDLWKKCVIVGNSCLTDSALVANQCMTTDTIHDTLTTTVYDTVQFIVNKYDTVRTTINEYDTTLYLTKLYDTTYVELYDTVYLEELIYDTSFVKVTINDTTYNTKTLYDTTFKNIVLFDTAYQNIYAYDTLTIVDTIFQLDTNSFSVLDSVYINNKMFTVSNITKDGLESTPILITKIDTNLFNVGVGDTVTFTYDLSIYDNNGQFVNRVDGTDILFDGDKFYISSVKLISVDEQGYLISKTGKRLGNGVYIVRGQGVVKINGDKSSSYFYNTLEGYRRKQ